MVTKLLFIRSYLTSTDAPASSKAFLASSASSLDTAPFTGEGAPSTSALASLRPKPVNAPLL